MWQRIVLEKWQKFWRLTVVWDTKTNKYKNVMERCVCECWKEKWVTHYQLLKWIVRSCWCLLSDTAKEKQKKYVRKHWLRTWKNRFSRIYQWIRRRCKNPNDRAYPQYWGRGIKIIRDNIEEFYNDMHESYVEHCEKYWEKDTTIDRIDVNWDYCKDNCRWATYKEQQNNRTNNSYVMIDWVQYSPYTFAEKFNIKYCTAKSRMDMYRKGKISYETLTHIWNCNKPLSPKDKWWNENTK